MSTVAIIYLIIMAFLLVLSSFFSAADMAVGAVNLRMLKKKAQSGSKTGKLAYRYAKDYEDTIVTILFGNNLANILLSSLGAALVFHEPFSRNANLSGLLIPIVLLVLVLSFGEIFPKALVRAHTYKYCLFAAPILRFFELLFYPFSKSLTWVAKMMTKPLLKRLPEPSPAASDDELQAMVDDIEEEGFVDEDSAEYISASIEFKDTRAYEVMTPRVAIDGIEVTEDLAAFVQKEGAFVHSRLPVYKKNYDNILGYIPMKSLQKAILNGKKPKIQELMLPIIEVPRTLEISSILKMMKQSHHHIAIVKDEFGGTEGLVTLEDILEELVGELWDESEDIDSEVEKGEKRNVYFVKGTMNIVDFFTRFQLDEDQIEEDYDTLSGWITYRLGRFPKVGDKFEYKKLTVAVEKASAYVVEEAKVTVHPRRKIQRD